VDCRSHPNYHLHNSLRSFCPPPDLEIMAQRSLYLLLHRFSLSSPGVEAIDVGNHHVDDSQGGFGPPGPTLTSQPFDMSPSAS